MEDDQATDNPTPHELPEKWRTAKAPLDEAKEWFENAGMITRLKISTGFAADAPRDPFSMGVCQGLLDAADELEASLKAWDDSWKAQCHAQAEQIVKLRDLIFEMEWHSAWEQSCAMCLMTQDDGHLSDCELAKTMEPYR